MKHFEKGHENRLRKEYEWLRGLCLYGKLGPIIEIQYKSRDNGCWYPISKEPITKPYIYRVTYNMPMIVESGAMTPDWSGTIIIRLDDSEALIEPTSPLDIELGYCFDDDSIPYNSMVSKTDICVYGLVSKYKSEGIWRIIVEIGRMLNLEEVSNECDDIVLNENALYMWQCRNKRPISQISWPKDIRKSMQFRRNANM